ncbi:MAG: ABC transporter permease subunit [Desulfovibrio sp.]|nr:ABC transporter permease subunit [Desulfovibrio sp.]
MALPALLAAGVSLCAIVLLVAMILIFAAPAFVRQGGGGPFSWTWQPYQGRFGILSMLAGSVILSASALALAWPLSLGLCAWTLTSPRSLLANALQSCVRLMTAVPTVVYGFAAIFLITPLVRSGLGGSGFCWLAAALVLALLIVPTMTLILEAGLRPRLEKLCPWGMALGMSHMELLYFFVFPQSRKTLLAAGLLGIGRAFGDTLIPLMLAGNAPRLPEGPGDSLRTLTAHMALVTANEVGGAAYDSLFVAGALLLCITAAVSLGLRRLRPGGQDGPDGQNGQGRAP